MYEGFSYQSIASRLDSERTEELQKLAADITKRLRPFVHGDQYEQEVASIIEDLRSVGYDLWSHDYDGTGKEVWGGDYMHPDTMCRINITFDPNEGEVEVVWIS